MKTAKAIVTATGGLATVPSGALADNVFSAPTKSARSRWRSLSP